ncbi:rhomboid family intramembrane serine protease [Actinoplanes sp. NPDC051633]|uniref:rhomboid family intramembrane serine protease n=1 Tax=Actinoplanes sp. NPDC051633 TaxID=3155670 RepID=UPI00342F20F3
MTDSPVTVPVCYNHPSKETYVRCTRCDRPICPDCMNEASVGHQCPDCVKEGRRTQRSARTAFGGSAAGRAGTVTRTLIGVNVAVMVLSVATGGLGAIAGGGWGGLLGSSTPLLQWGSVWGYGIANGEWWRLFTAMFLHLGVLHLLVNMYALWILGRDLEAALGRVRFLALYLLAGLGGNVASFLFANPARDSVGASTAVFGLMAAMFVVLKRLNLSVQPIVPVLVINVIFTFTVSGLSKSGHLGGLIVGALAAVALAYAPAKRRTLFQALGCGAIAAVLVILAILRSVSLTT